MTKTVERPCTAVNPWVVGVWIAAAALALIPALQLRHRQIEYATLFPQVQINDFNRWLQMLPGFLHHHAAYVNDDWPMPPFTIVLLAPFSLVSFSTAQLLWVLIKLPLVVIIFYCCDSMVHCAGRGIRALPLALIAAAWFWPVIGDMQEGQVNLLMLTPLVLGLWLAQKQKPPTDVLAGLFIAIAVAIKVIPIIFLAYMLWRRRWLVSASMVLGVAFWLYIPTTLFFGWQQAAAWNQQYLNIMIIPYVMHSSIAVGSSESLPSFLFRLLTHTPAFVTCVGVARINNYSNILELSPAMTQWIIRLLLLAIGGLGIAWAWRRVKNFCSPRYLMEIGALTVFMLWAEEWSWVPHYVSLILPLMAVGMIAGDPAAPKRAAWGALWALIAAAVLMFFTTDVMNLFGSNGSNWGRVIDFPLFAGLALVLAIVTTRYEPDAEEKNTNDFPTTHDNVS